MSASGAGVAFKTLGCKVNRVESEDAMASLVNRGASIVPEAEADVVVINTCTVTGEADAKARKAVRHALRSVKAPVVVVTGCMAALDAEGLRALGERVVVEGDKSRIADRVAELLGLPAPAAGDTPPLVGEGARTRALVKVEDGCDAFCAYCIVPYARGGPRSVPADVVVRRVCALLERGAREVVLTGVNLGRYSDGVLGLAGLVRRVAETGVARIRLSSIEPVHLTDELLGALASVPSVAPHLHVPLQSGSDRVLAAMARAYTVGQYAEAIGRARASIPELQVTTDVIAGFPGETDADAQATLEACETIGFARLHVFRYSERQGTPAAAMPGQVPAAVRTRRAAALRELGARLQARHRTMRSGTVASVLVEEHGDGCALGTSEDYLRVRIAGGNLPEVGELVDVRLTAPLGDLMCAEW